MKEYRITISGLEDVSNDRLTIPWHTIENEFPDFIRNSRDDEVFYRASLQFKKSGKLYKMIFPHVIESCPFCSIELKAELRIRLLEHTFNYCPNCGKSIKEIYEAWRKDVVIIGDD